MSTRIADLGSARPPGVALEPRQDVPNPDLHARVAEIRRRHPAVGLALGVVRAGRPEFLEGHGLANVDSARPVTNNTVFRIGSITKVFTAIAVMQLVERGLIDLDHPANRYLHAYRLILEDPGFRMPTIRHLLTHTAGIPEVRGLADLLRADFTPSGGRPAMLSVSSGHPLPSLAAYYRDGLRVVVEPGTAFAYSNHGFATLGQIVEDVSGMPLDRYMREHLLDPLGMTDSDLVRSDRVMARLASGYVLTRRGPRRVPDRDWIGVGGGGLYSTPRDLARFTSAILGGGANEHGRILRPPTLAAMFEPHYQPHPSIPGVGLAWFRGEVGGHRLVGHDGILPGFNSALLLAPDDGVGLFAVTNGSPGAFTWLQVELEELMREFLAVPDEALVPAVTRHPEALAGLSGRYVFQPRISDLRVRLILRGGAEVFVRDGRLMVRLMTSVPGLRPELPVHPDAGQDPSVFRVDLTAYGMPRIRVAFDRDATGHAIAVHTDFAGRPWTLVRAEPHWRRWRAAAVAALGIGAAVAITLRARRRRGRRTRP